MAGLKYGQDRAGARASTAKPKRWIQGAIQRPGQLHRDLGVPQGETIPAAKVAAAAGRSGAVGRRARLAQTLKKMH